jgi:hypothetical protein
MQLHLVIRFENPIGVTGQNKSRDDFASSKSSARSITLLQDA